jgi:pyruvate/2-oxoglutarate dehydrogenase complex dihydrolipoamide dehydrogenase (E3) component
MEVVVIGAGPAGVVAALRAAELGAHTSLVTRDSLGGMAANDGPVPVRTLAQAARLLREARQLELFGIEVGSPALNYPRLLARVGSVVDEVRAHSTLRANLDHAGVAILENVGTARFLDQHRIACERGPELTADRVILCTGGSNRQLPVPGAAELTVGHSAAFALTEVPRSMIVVGAGATGVQVASIFDELGTRVQLFEAAPRILLTEDEDVSTTMAAALRATGVTVSEEFGRIERFEASADGVRMVFSRDGERHTADAAVAAVAIGWQADTLGLNLSAVGAELNRGGYVQVDEYLQTTAPGVFAAGDVTGRLMLVSHAVHDGYAAATNAVAGPITPVGGELSPVGSFTDPEYAHVGLTEAQGRAAEDVVVAHVRYDTVPRPIIDGRTVGFCKLIVSRASHEILGCHIVGERAVEIAQLATVAMAAHAKIDMLARLPFSFPTYTNTLGRAVLDAADQLGAGGIWSAAELPGTAV